ncbi:MAG: hypothetical protein KDA24_22165 [Deltaproteobacteria bacterium]|nr:hypothetical protein [Deltaproteobacteria bacterium]
MADRRRRRRLGRVRRLGTARGRRIPNPLRTRLALLGCALALPCVALLSNGLVFGVGDQDIAAVFVQEAVGGELFAGDLLAGAAARHPSLLWALVGALRALVPAEALSHIGVLLSLVSCGLALGLIGRELAPETPRAWVLGAMAAGAAQLVLGGAPTLDPLLVPRLVALPVELFALLAAVRQRWHVAFLLAGLALCVHAPSAAALSVGMGVGWVPRRHEARAAPLLALLGAGLALSLAGGQLAPMGVDGPSWRLIEARLAHHLVPNSWPLATWVAAAAWSAVAAWALRRSGAGGTLMLVLAGLLGWALLAGVLGPVLEVRLLLNLEPWQALRFVVLLASVAVPCAMPATRVGAVLAAAWVALCVGVSPRSSRLGPAERDVIALAKWASKHSEPGDLFVLPPNLPPAFRERAQRPVYALWKDGGEAQFDPLLGKEWAERMTRLCACSPFDDLPPEHAPFGRSRTLASAVGAAYDSRPREELVGVAKAAGAAWLVTRAAGDGVAVGPFWVVEVPRKPTEEVR